MTVTPSFRVIIAGGRDFHDYRQLRERCDRFLSQKMFTHKIVIISGTAKGADTLGERYAHERGYDIEKYPADWERDGKSAGPIRNAKMAEVADALIAFWDGNSRGTANMIALAQEYNLASRVIHY